jgi:uncharacterized protein
MYHSGFTMRRMHMLEDTYPEDTELCKSVYKRDINRIRHLIATGVDVNERSGLHGCTALKISAAHGQTDIMELLLQNGARVDMRTQTNLTPLFFAVQGSFVDATRLLLQHGANVSARSVYGSIPLDTAMKGAASTSNEDKMATVSLLLQFGADVNAHGQDGHTALMVAMRVREPGLGALVLQAMRGPQFDSAIDAADDKGNTALHHAGCVGNMHAVKLLLAEGAYFNIKNKDGRTPVQLTDFDSALYMKCGSGTDEIIRLIEDVREDVRVKTLQRVVALGGHSKASKSPIHRLPPGLLTRILGRDPQQLSQMTEYEQFVNGVAIQQIRKQIRMRNK